MSRAINRRAFSTDIARVNDFRGLLDRKDIDAIVIASPDHWHAIQTIAVRKAGKYVQGLATGHCSPASAASADWTVIDDRGRAITADGLALVDWKGYNANPAVRIFLEPPADAMFPARAILTSDEPRLHFDLPSEPGPGGPRKEVVWRRREQLPVSVALFPDRDGNDEHRS